MNQKNIKASLFRMLFLCLKSKFTDKSKFNVYSNLSTEFYNNTKKTQNTDFQNIINKC